MACLATDLAEDLILVNALPAAQTLIKALTKRDPGCDQAQALRVDLRRRIDSPSAAADLAERITRARTGLTLARSAWARSALAAGDVESAVLQASVAVERGNHLDDTLLQLSAVLARGGEGIAPFDKWSNMLKRDPTPQHRALGCAGFFARGEDADAAKELDAIEATQPKASGLKAMRAIALVREGRREEARAALAAAWQGQGHTLWKISAEAELATREARKEDAKRAWESYITRYRSAEGPVTREEAQAKLAALGGSPIRTKTSSSTPLTSEAPKHEGGAPDTRADEEGGSLLFSLIGLCIAFSALWWWRRSR